MISAVADLVVKIGLDESELDDDLKDTESKLSKWSKRIGGAGQALTAGLTAPLIAGFGFAIGQASSLSEALSANESVYGSNSKALQAWADDAATSFGLSKAEALTATNQMGQMFKTMGLSTDEAATFSQAMVGAAADLGSFNDVDPSVMLEAIRSGLVGEVEPLRQYGILLDAATVEAKAMEMGLADANGVISEGAKVKAREALILEQMGAAQGDYARTADGAANSLRTLNKMVADLAAEFGKILLPKVTKFLKTGKQILTWAKGTSGNTKKLIVAFGLLAASLGPVLIALSALLPALALLVSPIGLIVLAIAAIGVAYSVNLFGFRDAVNATAKAVWELLKPIVEVAKALVEAFRSGTPVKDLLDRFPASVRGVVGPFLMIADAIGDLVKAFRSGGLEGLLDELPGKMKQIAKAFFDLHKSVSELLLKGLKAAWPVVRDWLKKLPRLIWDALGVLARYLVPRGLELLGSLWDGLKDRWDPDIKDWLGKLPGRISSALKDAISAAVESLKKRGTELLGNVLQGLKDKLGEKLEKGSVLSWIMEVPGKIATQLMHAITQKASTLKQRGIDLLDNVRQGLTAKAVDIGIWIAGLPGRLAAGLANAVSGAWSALRQAGADLIQAFIDGATDIWDRRPGWLKNIMGKVGFGEESIGSPTPAPAPSPIVTRGLVSGQSVTIGSINITVPGYDKSPDELGVAIARELRLAGASPWR